MRRARLDRFRSLQHVISGAVIALEGFDKLGRHQLYVGALFFALGTFVLSYFVFDRLSHDRGAKWLDTIVHASEGIAFLCLAFVYCEEGKSYLPIAALISAFGFMIATLVHGMRVRRVRYLLHVQDREAAARLFMEALGFSRADADDADIVLRRPGIEIRVAEIETTK